MLFNANCKIRCDIPVLIILLIGNLIGCSNSPYRHSEYMDAKYHVMWASRQQAYRQEIDDLEDKVKMDADVFRKIVGDESFTDAAVQSAYKEYLDANNELNRKKGAYAAISRFMEYKRNDPTIGMLQAWFSKMMMDFVSAAEDHNLDSRRNKSSGEARLIPSKSDSLIQQYHYLEDSARLEGAYSELKTLNAELRGYFTDMQEAKRDDYAAQQLEMQRTKLLMDSVYQTQSLSNQRQIIDSLNRPRNCYMLLNTLTCR